MNTEEIKDRIENLRAIMGNIPVDKTVTRWAKEIALEVRKLESILKEFEIPNQRKLINTMSTSN